MIHPHVQSLLARCLCIAAFSAILLTAGCVAPGHKAPADDRHYRDRAIVQTREGVTVTAAVPSAKETKELFGTNLYRHGIQPVWLEVKNERNEDVTFLPVGLDPKYFTPIEAANINHDATSPIDSEVEQFFFRQGMGGYIAPGETRSGYIFSAIDEGTKSFNVDIVSDKEFIGFTFFIPVPGLRVDHSTVDWDGLYTVSEFRDLSEADFIDVIENEICCTQNKKGEGSGDPINLVIIGDPPEVYYSFIRAGWDETEIVHGGSAWRTMRSFIGGGEYRYSPISALYIMGRAQDIAFQKARDNIHERNHLRLWMTPLRYEGKHVWLGQISRDIGVRFRARTITTHKIDPDVDETREYLLENLAYAQSVQKIAYLGGVGAASISAPRGNLADDPYFTDGLRLVLWVTVQPVDITDIQVESWRIPPDRE